MPETNHHPGRNYLRCRELYLPERRADLNVVILEGPRIVGLGRSGDIPAGAKVIERPGLVAGPGLIDLHCHGGQGSDFADGTPADITTVVRCHLAAGTTTMLATVASCSPAETLQALATVRALKQGGLAGLHGVHLEGPWFSPAWFGCHLGEVIRDINPEEVARLRGYSDVISWITLAPELPGALDLIREFTRLGAVCAIGHSSASLRQIRAAMAAGLSHATHLWNAMPRAQRSPIVLEPGVLESVLMIEELSTEIIGDGIHVGAALVEFTHRIKGTRQLALVSDALRGYGLGPGDYAFGPRSGQMCRLLDEPRVGVVPGSEPLKLASSAIALADTLRILSRSTAIPLAELWEMASLTPARKLGIDQERGRLAPGHTADLLLLDADLAVAEVWKDGVSLPH